VGESEQWSVDSEQTGWGESTRHKPLKRVYVEKVLALFEQFVDADEA